MEKTATAEEIKKAFRRKARELHPDVNPAADAEERFKEINEAYDVLSDSAKRDQYDRYGTVGNRGPGGQGAGGYQYVDLGDLFGGGGSGGFGMEDLFSAFFGGVAGGRGGGVRLEGRDMAMSVLITLAEAAAGVEKEIVLDRLATLRRVRRERRHSGQLRRDVSGLPRNGPARHRSARPSSARCRRRPRASDAVRRARSSRIRARSARAPDACPTASTST